MFFLDNNSGIKFHSSGRSVKIYTYFDWIWFSMIYISSVIYEH